MRTKTQSGRGLKQNNRVTGAAEWWAEQKAKLYRPLQEWQTADGVRHFPVHVWPDLRDEMMPTRFEKGTRAPGSAVTKRSS